MTISETERHVADQLAQALWDTHQVKVVKDWVEPGAEDAPSKAGYWSLDELHTLQEAVSALAGALAGAAGFIAHVGSVTIMQVETRHRGLASKGRVKLTASDTSFDEWTVVHELAHVWDANADWRLSRALESSTGGYTCWVCQVLRRWFGAYDEQSRWPGCNRAGYFYGGRPPAGSDRNFNRKEDFAEAVAAYVYPSEAQSRVMRFRDDDRYREFLYYDDYAQTRRWAFVDGLVKGQHP